MASQNEIELADNGMLAMAHVEMPRGSTYRRMSINRLR